MIRSFFIRISLREKILLTAFIWVLIGIFSSLIIQKARSNWAELSETRNFLQVQELILDREAAYDERFEAITKRFDGEFTLDETELRNRLEAICKNVGVNYTLTGSPPRQEGNFSLYEASVFLNGVEMPELLAFYNDTVPEAPYMRLDALTLSPSQSTPSKLSAKFVFKSFEMETGGAQF